MNSFNGIKGLDKTPTNSSTTVAGQDLQDPTHTKQPEKTEEKGAKTQSPQTKQKREPQNVKVTGTCQVQLIGTKKKSKGRIRINRLSSEQAKELLSKRKARAEALADKALRKESKLARDRE